LANRIAPRRSVRKLDLGGEVTSLARDGVHIAIELANPHDAIEVANIAVVEDEIA
jgi:hypothetical protein